MIVPYAVESEYCRKVKFGGMTISYNSTENKVYFNGPEGMKFNIVYNKDEVDEMITGGGLTPAIFLTWLLSNVMIYDINTKTSKSIQRYNELVNIVKSIGDSLKIDKDFWELHYTHPSTYAHERKTINDFNDLLTLLQINFAQLKDYRSCECDGLSDRIEKLETKTQDIEFIDKSQTGTEYNMTNVNGILRGTYLISKRFDLENLASSIQDVALTTNIIENNENIKTKLKELIDSSLNPEIEGKVDSLIRNTNGISYNALNGYTKFDNPIYAANYPLWIDFKYAPVAPPVSSTNGGEIVDPDNPIWGDYTLPMNVKINGKLNDTLIELFLTAQKIKEDIELQELLKGPAGPKGDKGEKGDSDKLNWLNWCLDGLAIGGAVYNAIGLAAINSKLDAFMATDTSLGVLQTSWSYLKNSFARFGQRVRNCLPCSRTGYANITSSSGSAEFGVEFLEDQFPELPFLNSLVLTSNEEEYKYDFSQPDDIEFAFKALGERLNRVVENIRFIGAPKYVPSSNDDTKVTAITGGLYVIDKLFINNKNIIDIIKENAGDSLLDKDGNLILGDLESNIYSKLQKDGYLILSNKNGSDPQEILTLRYGAISFNSEQWITGTSVSFNDSSASNEKLITEYSLVKYVNNKFENGYEYDFGTHQFKIGMNGFETLDASKPNKKVIHSINGYQVKNGNNNGFIDENDIQFSVVEDQGGYIDSSFGRNGLKIGNSTTVKKIMNTLPTDNLDTTLITSNLIVPIIQSSLNYDSSTHQMKHSLNGFEIIKKDDANDIIKLGSNGLWFNKQDRTALTSVTTILDRDGLKFMNNSVTNVSVGRDGIKIGSDAKITTINTIVSSTPSDNALLTEKAVRDFVSSNMTTHLNDYVAKSDLNSQLGEYYTKEEINEPINALLNKVRHITTSNTATIYTQNVGLSGGNLYLDQINGVPNAIQFKLNEGIDYARITANLNGKNGFFEIATADEGEESIYVRQYIKSSSSPFGSIKNSLTLLDINGNTAIPNDLYVKGVNVMNELGLKALKTDLSNYVAKSDLNSQLLEYYTKAEVNDGLTITSSDKNSQTSINVNSIVMSDDSTGKSLQIGLSSGLYFGENGTSLLTLENEGITLHDKMILDFTDTLTNEDTKLPTCKAVSDYIDDKLINNFTSEVTTNDNEIPTCKAVSDYIESVTITTDPVKITYRVDNANRKVFFTFDKTVWNGSFSISIKHRTNSHIYGGLSPHYKDGEYINTSFGGTSSGKEGLTYEGTATSFTLGVNNPAYVDLNTDLIIEITNNSLNENRLVRESYFVDNEIADLYSFDDKFEKIKAALLKLGITAEELWAD